MLQGGNVKKGFSLLEALLIVAIVAIIIVIIILIANPSKQLAEARNAQRRSDINTILNAVYQYSIDNKSNFPQTITTESTEICKTGSSNCTSLVDLTVLTTNETYLVAIPGDPGDACSANGVCYKIRKTQDGKITVTAPNAELGAQISVTK